MPRLLAKENQENALACVLGVLFSEIIVLTVLDQDLAQGGLKLDISLTPQFPQKLPRCI